jgi:hypothetical protein
MLKKVTKVLPIALMGLFAAASVAWGAMGGVTPGTLLVSSSIDATSFATGNPPTALLSGINFNSLGTIDVSKNLVPVTALDHVFIADNSGTNAGWSVKVSATALTTTVHDSTAAATDTVTITIPADQVLTAAAGNPTPWFNSKPQAHGPSGSFSVGSTAATIMYANKGAGAGAYVTDVSYTLSLPKYLPAGSTVTASLNSSVFNSAVVTDLGLFAGSYSTTITYSLSVAP